MNLTLPAPHEMLNTGFAVVERLVSDDVVEQLRGAYDELIAAHVATDRMLGGVTRQIMVPSMSHPVFESNAALDAGRRLVAELFGSATAARTYDMLIDKPPGHPHVTPWHQDAGYFARPVAAAGTPVTFDSVQFWLALDDVDETNGCMQFVPRAHRLPTLEHVVVAGDPLDEGRLIGLADPATQLDLTTAVAAPLKAGGCTIHLAGTPHFTGANLTHDRRRRAYIFNLDPGDERVHPVEGHLRRQYVDEVAATRARTTRPPDSGAGLRPSDDARRVTRPDRVSSRVAFSRARVPNAEPCCACADSTR